MNAVREGTQVCVAVGQVWEDTYVTNSHGLWLIKVMRLNKKSARVEPCNSDGSVAGHNHQYRMEFSHFENGRMRLVHDTTTDEKVRPIITGTYGDNSMARALVDHLADKIDQWPNGGPPRYGAETREDMVRLTCWDWFSGGGTAQGVARKIEEALADA